MKGANDMVINCFRCKAENDEDSSLCYICGKTLNPLDPTQPYPQSREMMKAKLWIPFASLAIALALSLCWLFFFTDTFKSGDNSRPKAVGITTSSTNTSKIPGNPLNPVERYQ